MELDPVQFVVDHGVVLASARGPVPSVAEAVAGGPIAGSWWSHPRGRQIFDALSAIDACPDVKCFKLIDGKITLVHRRLWPALVRLADQLGPARLAEIRQEHTPSGAHRNVVTPFPRWVTAEVKAAAARLDPEAARAALGDWAGRGASKVKGRSRRAPARRRRCGRSCSLRRRSW